MNYFQFFQIPESFQPDEAALRSLFLKKSRQFHPDFHTQETDEKQAELLELSTQNNRAFQILSDAELRMRHVLEIHGLLENAGKNHPLPPEFLMEMMEINEAMMELEMDFDVPLFHGLQKKVAGIKSDLRAEISPILENWIPGNDLEPVRDFYLKSRYVFRIEEKLGSFAPPSDGKAS